MKNNPEISIVSVVIPFFQREPGLLRRSVESILAQQGDYDIRIIIVDDGSPIAASDELGDLLLEDSRLRVITQLNQGPGAARNNGLNCLSEETEFVAFMDSDDFWHPEFLKSAIEAMSDNCDIFFANSNREGFDETRFDWHAKDGLNLVASQHEVIDSDYGVYRFKGDFFDYAIVRSNIISTSALIYRRSIAPDIRFSSTLFNGQDRLFKLALAQRTERVAFASQVLVEEGTGVNIYDSSQWGADRSIILVSNYIRLSRAILEELNLNKKHQKLVRIKLNQSRSDFYATLLHLVRRRKKVNWKLIGDTFKYDPALILASVPALFKTLVKKLNI